MQKKRNGPAGAQGIQVVHSAYCPSRDGGECDAQTQRRDRCRASFRASCRSHHPAPLVGERHGCQLRGLSPCASG